MSDLKRNFVLARSQAFALFENGRQKLVKDKDPQRRIENQPVKSVDKPQEDRPPPRFSSTRVLAAVSRKNAYSVVHKNDRGNILA